MASMLEDYTSFRFSTAHIPPAQRLPMWHDIFGRSVSRRMLSMLSGGSCNVDMIVRSLARGSSNGGVCVQRMVLSGGVSAERTPELLADGNDEFVLHIHEAGHRLVSQCGREAMVGPGGGLLTSNADTSTIILPERARFAAVGLPRRVMMDLVPGLEDALVRTLPPHAGVMRLLLRYLDILDDERALETPALRCAVAAHIQDLCALALGATRDTAEIAKKRGLAAARLRAIKDDIARHLGDGSLSAATIALRQRVTPRYIHKLFENEGMPLSKFILGMRLTQVHRMLGDQRHADQTIAEIAYQTGFNDLSTFNREFRRRYNATPSEVRATART
jgi:AraC-like DNA-binding protein